MKWRVARGASVKLSQWSRARKALTKEELYPFRDLGYRRIGEGRVESHDSRTRELRVVTSAFGIGPWS
jgi:hypothetical protein